MDQWRNSEDMETRKKFNPLIYSWLQSDLDSLKNGKGDINNYKVQGRKAFAAVDAQDILNKAKAEVEALKKKLNDKIDDVPDQEIISKLKKEMLEMEIKHNDAIAKKDEEIRVLNGKREADNIQHKD